MDGTADMWTTHCIAIASSPFCSLLWIIAMMELIISQSSWRVNILYTRFSCAYVSPRVSLRFLFSFSSNPQDFYPSSYPATFKLQLLNGKSLGAPGARKFAKTPIYTQPHICQRCSINNLLTTKIKYCTIPRVKDFSIRSSPARKKANWHRNFDAAQNKKKKTPPKLGKSSDGLSPNLQK